VSSFLTAHQHTFTHLLATSRDVGV